MIHFCEKFDKIIRQFKTCNPQQTIRETEKIAAFYNAVLESHPELVTACLMKSQTGSEMTTNEMKTFLLQLEAQNQKTPEARSALL